MIDKEYDDLCQQAEINVSKVWNEAKQDPDFDGWDLIAAEYMKSAYEYRMDMIYAEIEKLSKEE